MSSRAALYTWRIGDRVLPRRRPHHYKVWVITAIRDLPYPSSVKLLEVTAEEPTSRKKEDTSRTFRSDAVRPAPATAKEV